MTLALKDVGDAFIDADSTYDDQRSVRLDAQNAQNGEISPRLRLASPRRAPHGFAAVDFVAQRLGKTPRSRRCGS